MRQLLLVLTLLLPLAGTASATPPSEPYTYAATLDAEPLVDRTVTLRVEVTAHRALDAPLRLDVPSWVEVEGGPEWRAQAAEGASARHEWRVTPTREGYWRAGLAVDASRAPAYANPVDPTRTWQPVGGCCLFVHTTDWRGLFAAQPEGAIPPENVVGFHTSLRALDEENAELTVLVSPQDERFAGQDLLLQIPPGNDTAQRAPADAPHAFTHAFALTPGKTVVITPAAYVRVRFEGGEHAGEAVAWSKDVACANLQVERVGDEVRERARWGCHASASPPRFVPASSWLMAVLLALAARSAYPLGPVCRPHGRRAPDEPREPARQDHDHGWRHRGRALREGGAHLDEELPPVRERQLL